MSYLYQNISDSINGDHLPIQVPPHISSNLNPDFLLRPYQQDAFSRFIFYTQDYEHRATPTQLLFHMATGSGKTLIMAGCMLHLYQLGYRHFVFFVNSSTIIEKTRDNFLNTLSSKYLFNQTISIADQQIQIKEVENFQATNENDINIVFTTIQGLHTRLNTPRENSITYEDFEDQKIVLISDEAHHINAETQKGKLNKTEEQDKLSWENTVTKVFNAHQQNYLLEFTATADLQNPLIRDKYHDKLLFDYPLAQFREDKYSKEVKVLQAELTPWRRALQAVILSQYRRKVSEQYGLHIKPVILLKSKTIADSQAFYQEFVTAMQQLKAKDLQALQKTNKGNILEKAFLYFKEKKITADNLTAELREDFSESKCIAIDSKSDSEEKQLIVNSLEDANNEYRAVFAVDKLNEGWDVLNLYDIVRLYNTREMDHRKGKVSKTTMSEAQLIGRGARYCPFRLSEAQPLYQRKYDEETDHPMRVCEELYYHAAYNPKYISELNKALQQIGIKDKKTIKSTGNTKPNFRKSDFYKKNNLGVNEQMHIRTEVKELSPIIRDKERKVRLLTGMSRENTIFDFELEPAQATHTKSYTFGEFSAAIKRKALNKLRFYRFDNMQRYFPQLKSMQEFISSDSYLATISIVLTGTREQVNHPSADMKLKASVEALDQIAKEIQAEAVE